MKLEIYMKSGNVIHLNGIKSCNIKYTGNTITSLSVETKTSLFAPARKLFVPSVDLSQIEGIVQG